MEIKDTVSEISESDIINEMSQIKSKGWTAEQLLRLCAVLTCENEALISACLVHEGSFAMLFEKYQLSEANWQGQWEKRGKLFYEKTAELQRLHDEHILLVMQNASKATEAGIAEAFEAVKPEIINPQLEKIAYEVFQPLVISAVTESRKDALTENGVRGSDARKKPYDDAKHFALKLWETDGHRYTSKNHFAKACAKLISTSPEFWIESKARKNKKGEIRQLIVSQRTVAYTYLKDSLPFASKQ